MSGLVLTGTLVLAAISAAPANPSAAYVQRTMKMLEASTAEHPVHVRVLFYGQSITAQAWTRTVGQRLTERYPTVKFEFRNAAIGGYTSNLLIRTADHDLYPWYPDLLFFHVYGPMDKYEEIVRRVRERTSAEIVIWTSHLNIVSKDKPDQINTTHDERATQIRAVAPKYHCMLIDLREKWRKYLAEHGIAVKDLLADAVHLNPQGCDLYARLISEELVRRPELGDDPAESGTITTVAATDPAVRRAADGSLTLQFTGNRVVAISDGHGTPAARASLLLDGKPMDSMPELWAVSRPSRGPVWMPAINHIAFDRAPVEEDWTLTCLPDSTPDGKRIHFRVRGTVTGDDGEGWNTEPFVSRSRRVIIEPADWHLAWALGYKKQTLPPGFQVTWRSYPLFTGSYQPQPADMRTVLVQGCANQTHTLTLAAQGGALGIRAFVIHTPPRPAVANQAGAADVPPGAAALGYTKRVISETPTLADIAPGRTGNYKWFSGQWYSKKTPSLDHYAMRDGVLSLKVGGNLVSAPLDFSKGKLPLLPGADGFYAEFDVQLSDNDPDHWPAVWLMPAEHDGRHDHYAGDPPGFERFMELDVDEGGFGPGLTGTVHSTEGVYPKWKHVQNPNNISRVPLDRSQRHTFGASYDPRLQRVTWWLDGKEQMSAGAPYVPAIAAKQHFYLILSGQSHKLKKPHWTMVSGVRAYAPPNSPLPAR